MEVISELMRDKIAARQDRELINVAGLGPADSGLGDVNSSFRGRTQCRSVPDADIASVVHALPRSSHVLVPRCQPTRRTWSVRRISQIGSGKRCNLPPLAVILITA